MVKHFLFGSLFGLLFSLCALWMLKASPWALLPDLKAGVFVVGAALMGGFINLLLLGKNHVSSD